MMKGQAAPPLMRTMVTTIATAIPAAARLLPFLAVRTFDKRRIPKMKSRAEKR